nr:hypothetical protein [Tanacetum cinerariifolium]GEX66251.1 hypothetical protein [Tanacetum cinerariifolium]
MMELVMHTEKNDTVFHTEKIGMLRLMVEINVGGMTTDVVDKEEECLRTSCLLEIVPTSWLIELWGGGLLYLSSIFVVEEHIVISLMDIHLEQNAHLWECCKGLRRSRTPPPEATNDRNLRGIVEVRSCLEYDVLADFRWEAKDPYQYVHLIYKLRGIDKRVIERLEKEAAKMNNMRQQ